MPSRTRGPIVATAALTLVPVSIAQVGTVDVDHLPNWPAPLYWQPTAAHAARPVNHGHIREEVDIRAAAATPATPAVFVAMSPCRVVETRSPAGPFGGPAFAAGETRTYAIPTGPCAGIPATAVAFSVNIAVIPLGTQMKWLTAWDTGSPQPHASMLNDYTGQITSNSAVVPAGTGGEINIFVTDPTQVIVDINGYYAPPGTLPLTGTAAAPALTFGDTTTGLYSDTAGTVSIATGGINRLTVNSDGDLELPGSIRKGHILFLHTLGGSNGSNGENTALGLGSMPNSTGNANTAVGSQTLMANTTGGGNTASGWHALAANMDASGNTAMGASALASNIGGGDNTAIGVDTLQNNTFGANNTALGGNALYSNTSGANNTASGANSLFSNTTGMSNTAIGESSLYFNADGGNNTAVGTGSLQYNTSGSDNTGAGAGALNSNTTGIDNTAIGWTALTGNMTGTGNTAIGSSALLSNASGNYNTAIGNQAGWTTNGDFNIYIANQGTAESNTVRIGDSQNQSRTFIAGIRGVTTGHADAIAVVIDSTGQLGTRSSSRRVKRDIHDMRDTTATILNLHPVEFRYTAHAPDSPLQYGLIAEEVAEIAPDLVARNMDGEIETVYYDKVNAMLLNHVQKLTREKDALADSVRSLESRLAALEDKAK
jgi:hypothetical protein